MPKEYLSTLLKLKLILKAAEDVNLTTDRQIDFNDKVKGHVEDLIETIEAEGTEAEG